MMDSHLNINKVKVAVGISNNVVDTTTFTRLATLTPTEIGWNEFEVELSGYTGTGNRITIMQTSTSTTAFTSYIDSLVVDTISSCDRPATVTVDNATAYGADLTWTDPSEAGTYIVRWSDGITVDSAIVSWNSFPEQTSFVVEYDSVPFSAGNGSYSVITTDTSYIITGLTAGVTYYVIVRGECNGDTSLASSFNFTTMASYPATVPYLCDFEQPGVNGWDLLNGNEDN